MLSVKSVSKLNKLIDMNHGRKRQGEPLLIMLAEGAGGEHDLSINHRSILNAQISR